MEADWSFAMGPGDPVMVVPWQAPGGQAARCQFVDLRTAPQRVDEIDEVREKPPLRPALLRLNSAASRLWTAKCGIWSTSPDNGDAPLDPYEMDAEPGMTAYSAGSYVDLLSREPAVFPSFEEQQSWLRSAVDALRVTPAAASRVELVMRPAQVDETSGFGFSWFVEGCGPSQDEANQRWAEALGLSLAILMDTPLAPI